MQFADAALNCPDEMSEEIIVQELATGITAIAKNDKISIANGQLVLANDAGYTKAFVYSLNGQLLNQLSLNPSAVNTVEIPQGATIIEFIGQNGLKAVVKVGR